MGTNLVMRWDSQTDCSWASSLRTDLPRGYMTVRRLANSLGNKRPMGIGSDYTKGLQKDCRMQMEIGSGLHSDSY